MKKVLIAAVALLVFFPLCPVFAAEPLHLTAYEWMSIDKKVFERVAKNREVLVDGIPVVAGTPVVKPTITLADLRDYVSFYTRLTANAGETRDLLNEIRSRVAIKNPDVYHLSYELNRMYFRPLYYKTSNYGSASRVITFLRKEDRQDNLLWSDVLASAGVKVKPALKAFPYFNIKYGEYELKWFEYAEPYLRKMGVVSFEKLELDE
jgi:hypothetical protein